MGLLTTMFNKIESTLAQFVSQHITELTNYEFVKLNDIKEKEKKLKRDQEKLSTKRLFDPTQKQNPAEKNVNFYTFKSNEQMEPEKLDEVHTH